MHNFAFVFMLQRRHAMTTLFFECTACKCEGGCKFKYINRNIWCALQRKTCWLTQQLILCVTHSIHTSSLKKRVTPLTSLSADSASLFLLNSRGVSPCKLQLAVLWPLQLGAGCHCLQSQHVFTSRNEPALRCIRLPELLTVGRPESCTWVSVLLDSFICLLRCVAAAMLCFV